MVAVPVEHRKILKSRISTKRSPFCFAKILAVPTMIPTPPILTSQTTNLLLYDMIRDRSQKQWTDRFQRLGSLDDSHSVFCRISQEMTKTAWINTATYHTWDRATGQLCLVSWHQYGSHVCRVADFFARNCFALTISSRWYCSDHSDVKAECPCTEAWVIHGVSWLWDHISAWIVTCLVVAHFVVSRWAMVISFCLWNFHM